MIEKAHRKSINYSKISLFSAVFLLLGFSAFLLAQIAYSSLVSGIKFMELVTKSAQGSLMYMMATLSALELIELCFWIKEFKKKPTIHWSLLVVIIISQLLLLNIPFVITSSYFLIKMKRDNQLRWADKIKLSGNRWIRIGLVSNACFLFLLNGLIYTFLFYLN